MLKKKMVILDRGIKLAEVAATMACCSSGPAKFRTDEE